MICDFCSSDKPTWKYNAKSFVMPNTGLGINGAWAACDECAALIEQHDVEGLAARIAKSFELAFGVELFKPDDFLSNLVNLFFNNRTGSAESIKPAIWEGKCTAGDTYERC